MPKRFALVSCLIIGGALASPAGATSLYVANYGANTISEVTPTGAVSTFASGFSNPTFLAFGPATVPEPSSLTLLGLGFLAFVVAATRQRHGTWMPERGGPLRSREPAC